MKKISSGVILPSAAISMKRRDMADYSFETKPPAYGYPAYGFIKSTGERSSLKHTSGYRTLSAQETSILLKSTKENRIMNQGGKLYIAAIFMLIVLIAFTPLISSADHGEHPDTASDTPYIHRGDWEPPDILFVAEDSQWQDSVSAVAEAAFYDNVDMFILSNREQGDQQGFLSELQRKYGTNILHIPYDSPWIRDYGPLQRKSAEHGIQWLDFDYAFNRPFDEIIPAALADHLNLPISDAVSYLEGGSIISNGRSLCAMTDRSLEEAEMNHEEEFDFNEFKMKIGCTVLAIIPALTNESTGHADIIAQFLTENIVAVASTMGASTVIDDQLEKAVSTLKASARIMGQQLQILRLPLYIDGEYFYSYINGTRLKQVYLAPSFKSVPPEMETAAYAAINAALPETILIPVPADSMAERGGAIHCITLGLNLPEEYVNPGYAAKWNELHIAKTLLPVSITIQN